MERMAVSVATGVMTSLLSKLSVLLSDQYKQLKGVRRDIESLSRELTDMNAALVKLANRENLDVQTKVWKNKVREMAYDVEDIIDIFMHHHGQGYDKDGLFQKTVRKIRMLRLRFQIAGMIQDIKARIEEHSQSRDRYKIDESNSIRRVVEVDPRMHALFEDAKRLVGIDGPWDKITKLLLEEDDSHSTQLKVVSVVGSGGLGKTTLANQVYNKIQNEFDQVAFVSISRTPDMSKILKEILSGVEFDIKETDDDVQKLIRILRAQLTNNRYLIVIDDLWNIMDWNTIKCAFVENNNGSRVIVTTCNRDVAAACCFPFLEHMYEMQPLDEIHSRRLFFKRLFDTESHCPEQFREISNKILRKCKGVPLAIISIASLLANQNMHVETWEKTLKSLGSELNTNPTMGWMWHVLNLSYNDLSHELKTCFLYLGTYPEDFEIHKIDLLRKWIAEGFIREKHGLDLEDAAENCLNELINRNMIQPCFNAHGEVLACQVHDLMLDLIISKCKEENFITVIDKKFTMNGATQIRRISHQFNNKDMALAVEMMSPSQVRSYNSFCAADFMPPLLKFELLRVLDLKNGSNVGPRLMCLDLSAINHLFLLGYLKVSGFCVELPKKFGNLKHLITLHMLGAMLHPGRQLPDLTSLSSLRHLTLPIHGGNVMLRNGLSKLCNIRSLFHFDMGTSSIDCIRDLGELTNLRDLFVVYSRPDDIEDNIDTILAASLEKLGNRNLHYLAFVVASGARSPSTQFWGNCFTHPQHLQRLSLKGLIPRVPNWMVHANRLAYLYYLEVQELPSDDFQVFAGLPCLIYLRLKARTVPGNRIIIHQNTFPSLRRFEFYCELSCLIFEPTAMPRLERILLQLDGRGHGGMQLQEVSPVSGIEHLASLQVIIVDIELLQKFCHHISRIKYACIDAIHRHPKSQAMQICVDYKLF